MRSNCKLNPPGFLYGTRRSVGINTKCTTEIHGFIDLDKVLHNNNIHNSFIFHSIHKINLLSSFNLKHYEINYL